MKHQKRSYSLEPQKGLLRFLQWYIRIQNEGKYTDNNYKTVENIERTFPESHLASKIPNYDFDDQKPQK